MDTLFEDITSGDAHRIWASSCAIAKTRDAQVLEALAARISEIRRATRGVELGGMLQPNSLHLDFALLKLGYVRAKSGCLCRLYPKYLGFDPTKEEAAGNVRITDEHTTNGWDRTFQCACALCGTRFEVEEGEYHSTWWKWKVSSPARS